jgi:predicted DNA-binding transcriptional regulator YafY
MSRNFQVVRVLGLFFLLCHNRRTGLTILQLCEALSVNKRTLYRDIQVLKSVGVVIIHQKQNEDGVMRLILKSAPFSL